MAALVCGGAASWAAPAGTPQVGPVARGEPEPEGENASAARVDVAEPLDLPACPEPQQLAAEIRRAAQALLGARSDVAFRGATPRPGVFEVRLSGPGLAHEALLPVSRGDCAELPRTVALLVRSWIADSWLRRITSPPPSPEPPVERSPAASDHRVADARVALALQVGADLRLGRSEVAVAGAAAIETELTRGWGLALAGGYQAPTTSPLYGGTVTVDDWSLTLRARRTVGRDADSRVELLVGPGLRVMRVRASGYPIDLAGTVYDAVIDLGTRLRHRIASPVWLLAAAQVEICTRRDVLSLGGVNSSIVLEPLRFNIEMGLAFDLW